MRRFRIRQHRRGTAMERGRLGGVGDVSLHIPLAEFRQVSLSVNLGTKSASLNFDSNGTGVTPPPPSSYNCSQKRVMVVSPHLLPKRTKFHFYFLISNSLPSI